MNKLAFLWKEAVFSKYGSACIICGNQSSFPHHYHSRGAHPTLAYIVENGIPLCWVHHNDPAKGVHGNSRKEIEQKIVEVRGQEWLDKLNKLSKKRKIPPQKEVEKYLRDVIE